MQKIETSKIWSSHDRRNFLKATAATITTASLSRFVHAEGTTPASAETVVAELYQSFTDAQRQKVCRSISDPILNRVNANWHVSEPLIGNDFFSRSQQAMIEKIVKELTSAEGFDRLQSQMDYDDGGLGAYSMAMFGKPNDTSFQWLLTGRHVTLRADGNTIAGRAFGGPIIYGHGETSAKDNLFYYQTKRVNEVFASLDKDQAAIALGKAAPEETKVALQGAGGKFDGIEVASLSSDQKELVRDVLGTLMSPFRTEDAKEALQIIDDGGGLGSLRFAFFADEDLNNDGIWDMWRIEGPNAVIHFRGAPHVHAYIHIGDASLDKT